MWQWSAMVEDLTRSQRVLGIIIMEMCEVAAGLNIYDI